MSYSFSFRERQTKKKGVVYDIIFRIVNEDGREVQKALCGYQTKRLAKAAYTEFMAHYIAPPKRYDGKSKVLYEFARDNYYGYLKVSTKESTLYTISHVFSTHVDDFFAKKDLATLKTDDLLTWQEQLFAKKKNNGEPYSVERLIRVRNYFKTFLLWCQKRYKIKNIFEDVDPPKKKLQKREYTIWTRADFEKFSGQITDLKYKALFNVLFFSGLRIGELQALTPECFDGQAIKVKSTYTRKTMDGSAYKITETKNYKLHTVPLPQHTIAILNEWLKYKQDNNLPNKYIFGGDAPISLNAIQNAQNKYTVLAGLPKIRLHDFRHSYVSMLISNGTNFVVVAALIGDTVEQVVKTYAHLTPQDLVLAVKSLD